MHPDLENYPPLRDKSCRHTLPSIAHMANSRSRSHKKKAETGGKPTRAQLLKLVQTLVARPKPKRRSVVRRRKPCSRRPKSCSRRPKSRGTTPRALTPRELRDPSLCSLRESDYYRKKERLESMTPGQLIALANKSAPSCRTRGKASLATFLRARRAGATCGTRNRTRLLRDAFGYDDEDEDEDDEEEEWTL